MAKMSSEDLIKLIEETTVPIIAEAMKGSEVADVIRESVATALAPDETEGGIAQHLLGDQGGAAPPAERAKGIPGGNFSCFVRALAAARNDRGMAAQIAKSWGRTEVAEAITRSEEKAMSSGDPFSGGFLVPTEFSEEFIELLRASGVVRGLNPTTIPMTTGSLKVPKITSGSNAAYVGENVNIGKSQLATGQIDMSFKKLAALVPVSNDLIRYAAPSADMIVRDDMVRAMNAREDLAFIRGDGLSGTPKGITNWVNDSNKFDADATASLATITVDLGKCMELLMDAEVNLVLQQGTSEAIDVRAGWIFHPQQWRHLTTLQTGLGTYAFRDEMLRGTLWGFPFRVTTQMNDDEVIFGAFAHAVIGESMGLMVDSSTEAAYYDGANVVSAYSLDQTVIRVLAEHDFALRHDVAFALVQSVTWGD